MPRLEINDYIIYKIICNDENITDCYVGSTANFNKRKFKHKLNCNNPNNDKYNLKIYEIIRENGGWDNWSMLPIAEHNEITLTQSRIIEEQYREQLDAKMNSQRAYVSDIQKKEERKQYVANYTEIHKEETVKYKNQWYEANKDRILEKRKAHYEANKEKIAEHQKAYYEANKEKISEQKKQYREKLKQNKQEIK